MKRRILLVTLGSAVVAVTLAAQDSLTVQEAVRRVTQTHPSVEQGIANARAAEARVLQAEAGRMPDVATEGIYTRIGPVPELGMPGLGTFKLYPENNYDAHIAGRYTVYDFGKANAAVDVSRSRSRSSRDAIEITKAGLAIQTVRTFYAILLLQESLQVQDEQIEAFHQHLRATEKRVAAGSATSFDVLTTNVRVAAAQAQKVDIQNALQKQQMILRQLLGELPDAPLMLKGELQQTMQPLHADSLIQFGLSHRPEVRLANDAVSSAMLQRTLSSKGNLPTVNVNGSWGIKNGFIPNLDVLHGNWIAGVMVKIPLYDGNRSDYQEEEAEASLMAEQAHLKDVEQQIRSEVVQVLADVQAAKEKVEIADVQLRQAHEAVQIARTRYETGSVTNLDLLDAEMGESSAKLASLQAVFRYTLSRAELIRAIGSIDY